jgi:hypothetical protein
MYTRLYLGKQRNTCQKGFIGAVRSAALFFAQAWLAILYEGECDFLAVTSANELWYLLDNLFDGTPLEMN